MEISFDDESEFNFFCNLCFEYKNKRQEPTKQNRLWYEKIFKKYTKLENYFNFFALQECYDIIIDKSKNRIILQYVDNGYYYIKCSDLILNYHICDSGKLTKPAIKL